MLSEATKAAKLAIGTPIILGIIRFNPYSVDKLTAVNVAPSKSIRCPCISKAFAAPSLRTKESKSKFK